MLNILIVVDSCAGEVVKFTGKRGLFISGEIKPALAGVSLTITAADNSIAPITLETTNDGKYMYVFKLEKVICGSVVTIYVYILPFYVFFCMFDTHNMQPGYLVLRD